MPGRNEPCPGGSGLKYKRCVCIKYPDGPESILPVFQDLQELPVVHHPADLQPYWDAVLQRFIPLQGPLVTALTGILRVVDVQDTLVEMGSFPDSEDLTWHKDETLRYVTRHLFTTERPLGNLWEEQVYSPARHQLAIKSLFHLGHMSRVRDHIESVRVGYSAVEIDAGRRIIRFVDQPETVADIARWEYGELEQAWYRRLTARLTDEHLRDDALANNILERLKAELRDPLMVFGFQAREESVTRLFVEVYRAGESVATNADSWLPDDVDLGCYTAGEFRTFTSGFLWAWALMHQTLMGRLVKDYGALFPPHVGALLRTSSDYIVSQGTRMMDFNEAAARQIVRDLTYTTEVLNPTPGLHPLLPVGGGNVVTIPRLLLGPRATADRPTDWIGRLLRILERAPWRAEARKRFGEIRESLMQSRLERGMAPFAVATRRNIKIASAGLQVGDIDLLVFRPEERVGLALSLKWYYPPDLVQEGASQAARLTEAVRKHLHVMAVFQETYEQIRRSHDLPSDVDFRPVVVVQPGPVFERARNPQVAVLTGSDFLNLASTASSFGSFIDAVARYEPPSIALQPSTDASVHLGRYTFRIPTYFIAPSERKRFGFDFAPGKPGMPWDLP